MLVLEMAIPGNQHCASCIGTLSFPMLFNGQSPHPPKQNHPFSMGIKAPFNTQGELTSYNACPRYDRHFVGITWHNV